MRSAQGMHLLERSTAWAEIAHVLTTAREGSGSLLVIEGPAGIGKTAMLRLALAKAPSFGMRTLHARGGELERDFSFGIVRQLLEPALAFAGPEESRTLLSGAAELAWPVFRFDEAVTEEASRRPVAEAPYSILHGLYWLCANLAAHEPLLLAVDDAHWADRSSLRFLEYMAPRLADLPVAMVLAARSGEGQAQDQLRRIAASAPVLALTPLSEAAVAELAAEALGRVVSEELAAACHEVTLGNPFFLRELVDSLADEQLAADADAVERVRRLAPKTIARAELMRLASLSPGAERLAGAVAVLGVDAHLRHATRIAELDEKRAVQAVDALTAAAILRPGHPLDFVHPIVRSSIYADLPAAARARAHRQAADMLAAEAAAADRVAAHLLAVPPAADLWVVSRLREAAATALAAGAPEEATGYLRRALTEPPPPPERASLLLELGTAQASIGEAGARDSLRSAVEAARDRHTRALAGRALGYTLLIGGAAVDAVRAWEEALAAIADTDDDLSWRLEADILVAAETTLSSRQLVLDRMASARTEIPKLDGARARPLRAIVAAELGHTDGAADEAAELAQRALADGALIEQAGDGSVPVFIAVEALILADRLCEAKATLDAVLEGAQSRGSLTEFQNALCLRSQLHCRRGQIADAEADARLALGDTSAIGADMLRAWKLAGLADALLERGDVRGAEQALSPSQLGPHDPDAILYQPYRDSQARVLLQVGRFEEALEHLHAEAQWEAAWGVRNPGFTDWRSSAALAQLARGDAESARKLAAEELQLARAFGSPRAIGVALRTGGLVDRASGIDPLRESVRVLAKAEGQLEYLKSLVELGAALRRAGRRREACEPLRVGLDLAHRRGAEAVARRAHEELRAAGAKPRRRQVFGPDALTPSEARVARMAADGLSNREIAQALFVTMKTVAYHLTHSYRKLGIASREGLAQALEDSDEAEFRSSAPVVGDR